MLLRVALIGKEEEGFLALKRAFSPLDGVSCVHQVVASPEDISPEGLRDFMLEKDVNLVLVEQGLGHLVAGVAAALGVPVIGYRTPLVAAPEPGAGGGRKGLAPELFGVLDAVQDAIEIADAGGNIVYVNPAFSKVTGIPSRQRLGRNIFEVSPRGALAKTLITHRPVVGQRTTVGGSGVEVLSSAAPIFVAERLEGAVVFFQPMNSVLKLMEELQKSTTVIENLYAVLGQVTGSHYSLDDLVGVSKVFRATVEMARKAARGDGPVLITGESGTGKEVYAHGIHQASARRDRPLLKINCASIPESLLETEFFGYDRGTYASVGRTKMGKLELAHTGTLFIDEIGELSMFLQQRLLQALQRRATSRVGGSEEVNLDVRIIAASNRDLRALVRRGVFLPELYYHLSAAEIMIPPLRERREDIPPLVANILSRFNRKLGRHVRGLSPEALQLLADYDWPGNVRELEEVMERAMLVCEEEVLKGNHLAQYIGQFGSGGQGEYLEVIPLDRMEELMLKAALARYGESLEGKKRAAQALNISLATLYNKIKKYKANLV